MPRDAAPLPPALPLHRRAAAHGQSLRRVLLSHYVLNGLSSALGLLLIAAGVHVWLGPLAGSAATVGVIVSIPPDGVAPRRGKFWHLLPAPLLSIPRFLAVQLLLDRPALLGLLVVPATFLIFLGMAWGKRGAPVAIAIMLAMVFAMAVPARANHPPGAEFATTLYFALGTALYLPYAVLMGRLLNARYRVQLLADALLSTAALMRLQAQQFSPSAQGAITGRMLLHHTVLAEQLQSARDMVLEAPDTPRRQRLAGMLLKLLEMRDHLLACDLDLDKLRVQPDHHAALAGQQAVLQALAGEVERLADALLLGRRPLPFPSLRPRLHHLAASLSGADLVQGCFPPALLVRGLGERLGYIDDEVLRSIALARGEADPDLAVVRSHWQLFVSPTAWSWQPLASLWRWQAPPLRHALRAAAAIAVGFALTQLLPWGGHTYWVLLTIIVVLRGSLAQTLERRNSRVIGTLLGCVLTMGLLSAHLPALALVMWLTLAQAVAHAFVLRRYVVTAVAVTTLGLLQAHMLNLGDSTAFALVERIADTLIGTAIAWGFAYVLPSWERTQIPGLVARTLKAQAHHARVALALGQLQAVDNAPELAWRLARREAYDSLTALVQATQRSLVEPRAVRPPLAPLERLQARSHQLLAQHTAVKTLLLLRRGALQPAQVQAPLEHAGERICALLLGGADGACSAASGPPASGRDTAQSARGNAAASLAAAAAGLGGSSGPLRAPDAHAHPEALPGPHDLDLSPWLLRRLALAMGLAAQVHADADAVLATLAGTVPAGPEAPHQGASLAVQENQKR